jgi:F-type H+-transporting ATPase subunit epsilon
VTLDVRLVVPEGEIWAGRADNVIAKTLDGDIGILTSHTPVLGILAIGSVVRIHADDPVHGERWVEAAVSGGFLSVKDDKVSILARRASLGTDVDPSAVRAGLDQVGVVEGLDEDSEHARYLAAQLRAAGQAP